MRKSSVYLWATISLALSLIVFTLYSAVKGYYLLFHYSVILGVIGIAFPSVAFWSGVMSIFGFNGFVPGLVSWLHIPY